MSEITYITNPRTGRPVKVGSNTWKKLVRENTIEGEDMPDNALYEAESKEEARIAKKIMQKNKQVPKNKTLAVKGNKVVKRAKRLTQAELTKQINKCASRVFKREQENINPNWSEDKIAAYIENKILEEMLKLNIKESDYAPEAFELKKQESASDYESESESEESVSDDEQDLP